MDVQLQLALYSAASSVLGALVGGVLVLLAGKQERSSISKNLEDFEIRKKKTEIVYQLLSYRYVLKGAYKASSSEVEKFNSAICGFPLYFRSATIREAYERFLVSKTDDNLITLLQVAARSVGLDLSPSELSSAMTVNAGRS